MKQKRILVADDDPSILKLILAIIKREGYEGLSVTNGREAVQMLGREKFDLVICDQTMPHLTGAEVADWMRQTEKNFDTPFILLTAEQNPTLFSRLLSQSDIDSYLPKPISFAQITAHLKMMLNSRIARPRPESEFAVGERESEI